MNKGKDVTKIHNYWKKLSFHPNAQQVFNFFSYLRKFQETEKLLKQLCQRKIYNVKSYFSWLDRYIIFWTTVILMQCFLKCILVSWNCRWHFNTFIGTSAFGIKNLPFRVDDWCFRAENACFSNEVGLMFYLWSRIGMFNILWVAITLKIIL